MKFPPPHNRNRLLLLSALPFPLAIGATFALVLLVGERFPRQLAPDATLAPAGLAMTLLAMGAILSVIWRQWTDDAPRRFALLLVTLTSLLAWPVWTIGIAPSVNGMRLGPQQASTMRVVELTMSRASKGRSIYYWARLRPADARSRVGAGRYFVPQHIHERWQARTGAEVTVRHATGLLGAETIISFE